MLKTKNTPTKTSIKPKITLTLTELNGILHAQEIQRKHQGLIRDLLNKFGKTACSPLKARKIWGKDTVSLSKKIVEMREGIASPPKADRNDTFLSLRGAVATKQSQSRQIAQQ